MNADAMNLHAYIHVTKDSGHSYLRIKQDRYTDSMKARMQHVGSPAQWDQSTWEWQYPLTPASVTAAKKVAEDTGSTITWADDLLEYAEYWINLDKYEDQVRRSIEATIRSNTPVDPYPTNTVNGTMNPFYHQSIVYHWSLRTSGLLLSHEPGLGKTRSSTDSAGGWYRNNVIKPMQQEWRPMSRARNGRKDKVSAPYGVWGVKHGILIVCPKVMIRTWREELFKWQNMSGLELTGSRKKKIERAGTLAHAHIINYESLPLIIEMGNQYDAIIVDECHKCANHSDQTMNVLQLSMKATRRLLLSGTPVSNNLEAVFYQVLICDGGRSLGASRTRFIERYFNTESIGPGANKTTPKEGSLEAVSNKMASCTYFLKKEDVLDLPEKTHTPLYLPMTDDQRRYYNQLKNEAVTYIQDKEVTTEMAVTRMMKLAQICQGFVIADDGETRHFSDAKTNALMDMLINQYSSYKMVIWGRFTYEIERLCNQLHQSGMPYLRYDGTTKQRERDRAVDLWNTDPNIRVFVGQLQMGIGITLHAKDCAVPCFNSCMLGLDYSYVNLVQARDRIHRIGQRWPVSYTYLLTEDGVDGRIYKALQAKEATADAVHKQGKDFYLSLLTDDTPNLALME